MMIASLIFSLIGFFLLGRQETFRSEINHDESPIESLKVSHSKFVRMIDQSRINLLPLKKLLNYSFS